MPLLTSKSKDNRKNCPTCKGKFKQVRQTQKYCNRSCKQSAAYKRKVVEFHQLAFGSWLIGQCRRAGTVQILQGFELIDLYNVWNQCRKANGFNVPEDDPRPKFEISHIAPASNVGAVGTLHPRNLVIAPAPYNRARCNNWNGESGVWLEPRQLRHDLKVFPAMSTQDVSKLITGFIPEGIAHLFSVVKPTLSFRAKMVGALLKAGVASEHRLNALPYDDLVTLYERLQAATERKKNTFVIDRLSTFEVYLLECKRLNVGGVTEDEFWLYERHSTECWDHLHCGELTIGFHSDLFWL